MSRSFFVFIFLGILFTTDQTKAELPLSYYKERIKMPEETRETLSFYLTGLGRGIIWTNSFLASQKQSPIFCMPPKLSLNKELVESLLAQEIDSPSNGEPYPDDTPIELIMVVAFKSRFPCN